MNTNTAEKLFKSTLNFIMMDKTSVEEARNRFVELQKIGVIKENCQFDDSIWYTTDEYSNVGFHFSFERIPYKQYEEVLELSYNDFLLYVKAYLVSLFGRNALTTMRNLLLDLRHIVANSIEDIYGATESLRISLPALCSDFFSTLPIPDSDESVERLMNAMESYADINFNSYQRKQRALADFDTYFLFDDMLNRFWSSPLSSEERLFYYPLYLWWKITAVLPLRPREFLLTERDCLFKDASGDYYLRLRRNQLKGGRKDISYKLSGDYAIFTCKIPDGLAAEIQQYIDLTDGREATDIGTLFVTDPHYVKWGQRKHSNSRFLSYMNMNTILRYFYKEVLQERYGLAIVYERNDRHLADNEIGYIRLGDTRHIALINIMQEGGTPGLAMLLAGHNNEEMSSHYYSNLTHLIECKTYRRYRALTSGNVQYQISGGGMHLPEVAKGCALADGGCCYSKAYSQGEYSDCLACVGENGEIAYCPACAYYRKAGTYFSSDDVHKRNLKDDCTSLRAVVDLVREGKGNVEDIGEVLLKLRASSYSYEAYLLEKYKKSSEV